MQNHGDLQLKRAFPVLSCALHLRVQCTLFMIMSLWGHLQSQEEHTTIMPGVKMITEFSAKTAMLTLNKAKDQVPHASISQ